MLYDLSQPLADDAPHYPGDPAVRLAPWPAAGSWRVTALALGSHSGTHLDAPRHLFPDGAAIGDLPVARCVGSGVVLDATRFGPNQPLPASLLGGLPEAFAAGWFVLLRTGWDRFWGDPTYFRHPFLSPLLAERLAGLGAGIVGIDALNVDSSVDGGSAAHAALLAGGALIVENLRGLDALDPGRPYGFAFLPLPLGAVDGSPIRAVAWDPATSAPAALPPTPPPMP